MIGSIKYGGLVWFSYISIVVCLSFIIVGKKYPRYAFYLQLLVKIPVVCTQTQVHQCHRSLPQRPQGCLVIVSVIVFVIIIASLIVIAIVIAFVIGICKLSLTCYSHSLFHHHHHHHHLVCKRGSNPCKCLLPLHPIIRQ